MLPMDEKQALHYLTRFFSRQYAKELLQVINDYQLSQVTTHYWRNNEKNELEKHIITISYNNRLSSYTVK